MEKIIAVVVMIAIVIGLIATAVLPMVGQMNEQGATANNQLTQITQTMQDGNVMVGSTVKAEILSMKSKFDAPTEKITEIKITGTNDDVTYISSSMVTTTNLAKINDTAMFTKSITEKYNSGATKRVEYKLNVAQ